MPKRSATTAQTRPTVAMHQMTIQGRLFGAVVGVVKQRETDTTKRSHDADGCQARCKEGLGHRKSLGAELRCTSQ